MSLPRFFIDPAALAGEQALLTGADAHHLSRVLRLKAGDMVELCDGNGLIHTAQIIALGREEVTLRLLSSTRPATTGPVLHLGLGVLKGKKMDLALQKCTELGASSIHPFLSEHSAVRPPEPDRLQRWQRITVEACKQCKRPEPPICRPVSSFAELLTRPETAASLKLIFWEKPAATPLRKTLANREPPVAQTAIFCLIGPEGGFSQTEIKQAVAAGFQPVGLGPRILRAETAALVAIALLQYLHGGLG